MDLPLEGTISGPSTGFEVTVPGRQGIRAMRKSIPLAGAPTSIETSLRGLYSVLFLPVVSWQRRAPCSLAGPAARYVMSRKSVMPARSSGTQGSLRPRSVAAQRESLSEAARTPRV
jgi:hypothetical protein